jgi:hypothetical protein
MATTTRPGVDPSLLPSRLAGLRRRLRFVILCRGVGFLLGAVLLVAVAAGLLDWHWHLPGLVRAVFLAAALGGGSLLAYRYLFRPLSEPTDDLTLALRVEKHYPGLNDCLASTVQFLELPEDADQLGSAGLRREAVRRALRRVQHCDFNRVIDARSTRSACFLALGAGLLAGSLVLFNPPAALTALLRLVHPFGAVEWPKQTLLEIDPPRQQIGRNEPFDIHGRLRGVVPDKAIVLFQPEGLPQVEQVCDVARAEDGSSGTLFARLEPSRVQRNFTFQVRANDAVSERYRIAVLPPPLLVPLGGRASPQVRLDYPAYTDLPPIDLPDGSGNVEAVAGTVVTFRAAADRPLAGAWVEYQPEPRVLTAASMLAPLATQNPSAVLALAAGSREVWAPVPAELGADRRELTVRFLPRVSGLYVLHFEDDAGLRSSRIFELHVQPDPAPAVNLERPTPSRDSLALLPEAEFTLQVTADDPMFAVRSVGLEYRCPKEDPPRRLPLYDHRTAGLGISGTLSALTSASLPVQFQPLRLRPQHVPVGQRISLKQFRHLDGTPLKEGDVLVLQAVADDFDDVAVNKQPGRSHEIEIQIIGRNALEIALNKEQARIQQELVKLREQQRDALKKVTGAEPHWKRQGKLTPEEVDQLQQAEQLQQQIRERVGPTKQDGLRSEVSRLLDTLRDNQLPRSAVHERMEAVASELDRLAREELGQIEPRLSNVRKENETGGKKEPNLLTEARKHQEEVEKTLNDLLSRLEPWTSTQEIKGEAKSILQEQRQLAKETEKLQQDAALRDKNVEDLTDAQRAELDRLQEAQQKLEQRTAQLLDKMDRVSQDRKQKDPETAKELEKAHQLGTDSNITGQMQDARTKIGNNQLNEAGKDQKETAKKLENLVKELEDRRADELDRMAKKLRQLQDKMDEVARQQEQLQKKVKAAAAIKDPERRAEELKRLAREQERLHQEAQDMLRQLSRLRAGRASQAMSKAAAGMEQSARQLSQGQDAEDQQDDALDRLDEAERELQRSVDDAEEELAREQLGKIADELKRVKERQESLTAEAERIQKDVLQRKGWGRGLLISLGDLGRAQKGLSEETAKLAKEKLEGTRVFARILGKAAQAMGDAHERIAERYQAAGKDPHDTAGDERIAKLQKDAVRRLDQLLDAIRPEPGVPQRMAQAPGKPGDKAGKGSPGGDMIPPQAQLKLLMQLQEEVAKRTEEFARQHPDPKKLTDDDRAALQALHRDQQEVAELLDEMAKPAEPEGDKP